LKTVHGLLLRWYGGLFNAYGISSLFYNKSPAHRLCISSFYLPLLINDTFDTINPLFLKFSKKVGIYKKGKYKKRGRKNLSNPFS
jgi:hypothetical protein